MLGSKFKAVTSVRYVREEASPKPPQMKMMMMMNRGKKNNSETRRFPAQTHLSDALVVRLSLGGV